MFSTVEGKYNLLWSSALFVPSSLPQRILCRGLLRRPVGKSVSTKGPLHSAAICALNHTSVPSLKHSYDCSKTVWQPGIIFCCFPIMEDETHKREKTTNNYSKLFTVVGKLWRRTMTQRRRINVFVFCVNCRTHDVWPEAFQRKTRWKAIRQQWRIWGREKPFELLNVFYQWHLAAYAVPGSYLQTPFHWKPLLSIFIQHFITIIKTMHKKDKLIEAGQPETWICEAYFHLSFLSSLLLCCSFLFRSEECKETCLFFQPAPHYGAFQVCSFVRGQPRDVHKHSGRITRRTLRQSRQPRQQRPRRVQHERYML